MRILDLPKGRVLVDEADWSTVSALTVYIGNNGYAYYSRWVEGRSQPDTLHSLLVGKHPGMHIDHINGDKLDNRRSNLRVVTPSLNQANRHRLNRNNTSGHRGVVRRGPRWLAQISVNHRMVFLGSFATADEAVIARRNAEILHYGETCP